MFTVGSRWKKCAISPQAKHPDRHRRLGAALALGACYYYRENLPAKR